MPLHMSVLQSVLFVLKFEQVESCNWPLLFHRYCSDFLGTLVVQTFINVKITC